MGGGGFNINPQTRLPPPQTPPPGQASVGIQRPRAPETIIRNPIIYGSAAQAPRLDQDLKYFTLFRSDKSEYFLTVNNLDLKTVHEMVLVSEMVIP